MTTVTIETSPKPRCPGDIRAVNGSRSAAPVALDPETLVDAYGAHRNAAYGLAYGILRDGPAAEDAVQDTFIKLWKRNAQFDASRGSMRGLVLTMARHTSIDMIRKRTRRQQTENTYCTDATYVKDGPERETERADEARHVRDALRALPYEQRRAIELAYFAGLTRREIAASGTVPLGTVKSRMRLGMRKLAVTLGDPRSLAHGEQDRGSVTGGQRLDGASPKNMTGLHGMHDRYRA
jgi:RNA polymerase sigma-70 factor (ECF subfamily)